MTHSKRRTPRAEARFACIEKYLDAKAQTGLTQKAFCAQAGLALTTFQNWLKKYRRQHHADQTPLPANRFIPLSVSAPLTPALSAPAATILQNCVYVFKINWFYENIVL
ncbi:MAG: hypothetical protein ONB46_23270 [candidate division KSB1 bacterium]|nr:hypothetical protein [candidate division KSB1 bacterium]MDZ7368781.1 hypothetical protein [candidate division KSB1 bacterium]MDZ7406591.1 hypothetical protein [candidate division KSB1 bacterium]